MVQSKALPDVEPARDADAKTLNASALHGTALVAENADVVRQIAAAERSGTGAMPFPFNIFEKKPAVHQVESGDNLWSIARDELAKSGNVPAGRDVYKYVDQIAEHNKIKNKHRIQDGQMLEMPEYNPNATRRPASEMPPERLPKSKEKPERRPDVQRPSDQPLSGDDTGPKRPLSGTATTYGEDWRGRLTSSGETFNPDKLTAASVYWPNGTMLRVTRRDGTEHNGKSVEVKINDWGPNPDNKWIKGTDRNLDLSTAAANKIGFGSGAKGDPGKVHYEAELIKLGDGPEKPEHLPPPPPKPKPKHRHH